MNQEKFESWALIELFGHNRIAGRVSEQQLGGESFVRVDVPDTKGQPAFTKLFGKGAIYAITLTDEKSARMAATAWAPRPMDRWEMDEVLRKQKLLEEPAVKECPECGQPVGYAGDMVICEKCDLAVNRRTLTRHKWSEIS